MGEIHVILISSVRPEPTSAGQMILYRHLVNSPGITLEVYGGEPKRPTISRLIRRIVGRIGKLDQFRNFVEDFWVLWDGRWIDREIPMMRSNRASSIVLTVAHGDAYNAARRYAVRQGLPLVTIFHDWWPDVASVHCPIRKLLEYRFRGIYKQSDLAICVCEGMRNALGADHKASFVMMPIPEKHWSRESRATNLNNRFTVRYMGNLGIYGPMLGDALETSLKFPDIFLQVRGRNPSWANERIDKMRESGRLLDFLPRDELHTWLSDADAFLIPTVFDEESKLRMETCFPSKFIDVFQYGKPIILWGPEYCSSIQWAKANARALCVTDSDPEVLMQSIEALRLDQDEISRLANASAVAARTEVNFDQIQNQFVGLLQSCLKTK